MRRSRVRPGGSVGVLILPRGIRQMSARRGASRGWTHCATYMPWLGLLLCREVDDERPWWAGLNVCTVAA